MIGQLTNWIMSTMQTHGAATVFIGVIIESVIVPIPSPLIIMGAGALIIPTGYPFSETLLLICLKIVLPGAIASTIGAYFTYGLPYVGGKPFIDRFGKFFGLDWNDILWMEEKLKGRVPLMLFVLRALPIVPLSLISAACGIIRVPFVTFTLWTFLGSIPRCLILGVLGHFMHDSYSGIAGNINHMESLMSAGIFVLSVGLILYLRARMKQRKNVVSD